MTPEALQAIGLIATIDNREDLDAVIEAVNSAQDRIRKASVRKFSVGDEVLVEMKGGHQVPAVVDKINRKTVGVTLLKDGDRTFSSYRCHPSLLTKA